MREIIEDVVLAARAAVIDCNYAGQLPSAPILDFKIKVLSIYGSAR
jgi:hypothetical protein